MKKYILICTTTLLTVVLFAQNDNLRPHYLKIFHNAMTYNDPDAAINALHGYIAVDSNIAYKDTLSLLYFVKKSYYSSLILAEEVTKKDRSNVDAFARAAECYQQLGDDKTAISYFEQVCAATKNPYHFYKLAISQYSLKRIAECEASCKKILADTNSARIGVNFTNSNGSEQAVPVNAAALNLLGVMQMNSNNHAEAVKFFKQAITVFPDFAGAAENLKISESKIKPSAKPAGKPPATKPKG